MAEIVAYVKVLKGEVFAKRSDGSTRQLKLGEPVYADEFMVTGKNGYIELAMGNESPFVVPAGETVLVSTDMRSPANHREPAGADEAKVASPSELDAILAKIAAGGDPTELLAATAAGGAAGGGHQFVRLLRLSEELAPFTPDAFAATDTTPDIPFAEGAEEENLAPVVAGAPASAINTDEDTPFRGQLNASDANGDPLRYLLTSAPAHGVVLLNTDGSYTYTPDANYNGSDSFVVTVSDGRGGDTAITLDITVNPINDAPVANDVAVTVAEDGSVTGNIVATDVDGDALSYTLQTGAAHGTVSINADGSFQYQPVANYNGSDSFIVTVSDGNGGTRDVTVSVSVTPVNDAPVVNPVTLTAIAEDGAIIITAADLLRGASDVDGDSLSISALSLSGGNGLLISNGDGTWTFTPAANWNGAVSFNFSVTDGTATTSSTASLTVTPVNDAPVVNPVTLANVAEDGSIVITAAELLSGANDTDGDALSISALSLASGSGTLTDNGDGTWTFAPTADWNGDVSFNFSVTDGTATTNSTASLTVTPVNDAPVVNPVTLADVAEDGSILITSANLLAGASDVDVGDVLSVSALSLASGSGTLTDNGDGTWTFAPTADWNGDVSFNFSVTDGTATTNSTASLTVTPVNDAPVVNPVTLADVAEDGSILITSADLLAGASDVDTGDVLSVSALSLASGSGTLTDNGDGTWTFAPTADWNGDVSFNFSVTDGTATTSSTASLTVTAVNDAPVVNPVTLADVAEDGSILITSANLLAGASDVDVGDVLSVSALSLASGSGTLTNNGDGTWTFAPTADWNGDVSFNFSVTDGTATTSSTASLTVTPVNDAPVVNPVTLADVGEDGSILITSADLLAGASDVDTGDVLSVSALSLASGSGTLTNNGDGSWTFAPTADWNGDVSFNFSVTDGTATTNSTASLTVTPVNDPATIGGVDTGAVAEDTLALTIASGDLTVSDIDGPAEENFIAADISNSFGHFSLDTAGHWTFVLDNTSADVQALNDGDVSLQTFTVNSVDGTAHVITVTITGHNDAAVIGGVSTGSVQEDSVFGATGQLTITDVDNPAAFIAETVVGSFGSLSIDSTGNWTYTLTANSTTAIQQLGATDNLTDSVTVRAADGTTQVITLTIYGSNDAPVVTPVSFGNVAEDGSFTITTAGLLAGASDIDASDALTVSALTLASGNGTLTNNGDGTWTFAPAANWNGDVSFDFSVTDGTATTSSTASLTVTAVNDAPVVNPVTLASIDEDTTYVITAADLLAGASDVDAGDVLSVSALSLASGSGTLVDHGDGTWTFTPAANWNGDISFNFSVTDGTATVSSTASLTVTPVADAPVVNPVVLTPVAEDGATVITTATLLSGASDADGDALSISALSLATGSGTLVNNGDGSWTFTPSANWNGDVSFNFSVTDGSATTSSTASLVVTPVNDAPVVTGPITLSNIPEDGSLLISVADLLATASDIDGDALSVVGLSVGAGMGSIVDNGDGTWRFTPNANWHGAVTLSYSVSDGTVSVANSASLNVLSVADAPTVVADTRTGFEDGGVITGNVLSNDSDGDGDALQLTRFNVNGVDYLFSASVTSRTVTLTGVGSLQMFANGDYRFTPVANWNGNVPTVTYTATDGSLSSSTTLNITVSPVNDAPGFTGLATAINYVENTSSTITYSYLDTSVAITDIDGGNFAGGSLTVSLTNGVANQDLLRVANQGTASGQISVVGSDVLYNFGSGSVIIGSITGGSAGAPLVINLNANATAVAVDALMQRVQYGNSSQLPDTTARIVSIVLNDGGGTANGGTDTVSRTMTINVSSSNDAPTLTSYSGTVRHTEGGAPIVLDSNATVSDPELNILGNYGGSTLTFARSGGANASDLFSGAGTLSINAGVVSLAGVVVGSYDTSLFASGRFVITFANGVSQTQVNQVLQQVAYSTSSDAPPASVVIQSTFNDGNTGAQGTGGARASSTGNVTVTITAVNDAPVASADSASTNEDTPVTIAVLANDVDPDGNPLTVTSATALHGTVIRNADGTLTYTPAANYNGSDTISYTISDGRGGTSSSTVSVTVAATNDSAVIGGTSSGSVSENNAGLATASGTLTISDIDGSSEQGFQTQDVSDAYGHFTLDSTGHWQFTLDNSSSTVQALGNGETATRAYVVQSIDGTTHTVTVTINGANDAPITNADSASTNEDTPVIINVLGNDSDPESNPLTVTGATALHGSVTVNADGTLTYTPVANYNGSDTISYTVSDGRGGSSTGSVAVNIAATPDVAIIGGSSSGSVSENNAGLAVASGTLTVTDADGSSEESFQTQDVSDAYGRFTLDSAGHWQFTLDNASSTVQAMNNADSVSRSYSVQSADGTTHTVTVNITGANDSAVITGTSSGSVVEDGSATATGSLTSTDVDNASGFIAETVAGSFGTVTINASGNWTYTLTANSSIAVQGLDSGQSITDTVTVRSIDGTAQLINITIQGQNDAPTATADRVITNITAGQNITIPVSALTYNDVDPDRGEQLSISGTFNVQNGQTTLSGSSVTFRDTIATGSNAGQVSESSLFAGDSETNALNNSMATAYTINRSQLGTVSAADAASVGNAALPSFRWSGRIDDTSGAPAGVTDQDYLRIYLRAGETLSLDVDGADSGLTTIGTDPNAVDMYLMLFNAAGTMIASNDDAAPTLGGTGSVRSGYHSNSLDSYLTYTASADGYYYVNATAWNNNGSGILQDDGNYQLWVSVQTSPTAYSTGFDYTVTDGNASSSNHVTMQAVTGSTLTGTSAGEILLASDQADTLNGLAGNDVLLGNAGNDVLNGGDGTDRLLGGSGNDQLTGGTGADVFVWSLGDEGSAAVPARDTVTDFRTSDNDVLDLSALLQNEQSGSLESYLHFSTDGSGNTRVEVWSDGDKSHGANQIIDLQGIDLTAGGTLADTDIITQLVQQGRLRADGHP